MVRGRTYEEVYQGFRWQIPPFYNIAVDVCDRWAHESGRTALIYVSPDETEHR